MKGVGESERHCKLETPLPTSTCTVFQQPPLFKILSQSALAKKEKNHITLYNNHLCTTFQAQRTSTYSTKQKQSTFSNFLVAVLFGLVNSPPHKVSPIQQTPIAPKPKPIWENREFKGEKALVLEREREKWLKRAKSVVVLKTPKSFTAIPKPKNPNLWVHSLLGHSFWAHQSLWLWITSVWAWCVVVKLVHLGFMLQLPQLRSHQRYRRSCCNPSKISPALSRCRGPSHCQIGFCFWLLYLRYIQCLVVEKV